MHWELSIIGCGLPRCVLPCGLPRLFFAGSLGIVDGGLDDDLARLEAVFAEIDAVNAEFDTVIYYTCTAYLYMIYNIT